MHPKIPPAERLRQPGQEIRGPPCSVQSSSLTSFPRRVEKRLGIKRASNLVQQFPVVFWCFRPLSDSLSLCNTILVWIRPCVSFPGVVCFCGRLNGSCSFTTSAFPNVNFWPRPNNAKRKKLPGVFYRRAWHLRSNASRLALLCVLENKGDWLAAPAVPIRNGEDDLPRYTPRSFGPSNQACKKREG